ncbi:hypothetical protein Pmani_025861 [Petrolisthes manimaculis]|uniref:Uncharacterized protein n=1 Tax=Petrolisthes manimaculis TaxID=1843537 RepID=A0AAE1P4M6_9EUCA|nr:hypothetical protein Pmani_025861 [Petrolisthes manimaculis]
MEKEKLHFITHSNLLLLLLLPSLHKPPFHCSLLSSYSSSLPFRTTLHHSYPFLLLHSITPIPFSLLLLPSLPFKNFHSITPIPFSSPSLPFTNSTPSLPFPRPSITVTHAKAEVFTADSDNEMKNECRATGVPAADAMPAPAPAMNKRLPSRSKLGRELVIRGVEGDGLMRRKRDFLDALLALVGDLRDAGGGRGGGLG